MKRLLMLVILVFAIALTAGAQSAKSAVSNGAWTDLGSFGAGSIAYGVSAKGEVVTGTSATQGGLGGAYDRGFRWTQAGGLQGLGFRPGDSDGTVRANSISSDGSTIVGFYGHYPDCNPNCAFSWTLSGGFNILGAPPGGWYAPTPTGVSKDGSAIVGWASFGSGSRSWLWTAAAGYLDLGTLKGGTASEAFGISPNGLVVVGYSDAADGYTHAYRWMKSGMIDLGFFSGGDYSEARGASTNGSVVVGSATTQGAYYPIAFRWTKPTGKVALGVLPSKWWSIATGVSADGKTVVGYSGQNCCDWVAFRWTATTGMQSLNDWLAAVGVDASSANFYSAYGVTGNGNGVVGQLTNGDAYLALATSNKTGAPTFSPKAGKYLGSVSVTLSHTSPNASIYYTTDGSTPTVNSTPYTAPILVTVTTTIKAIAIVPGYTKSAVASGKYTIQ